MATISVVLPAYFSHATLGRCLAALAAQTRPPDEVIVVNSSDETDTAEVVSTFPQVHFIQSPQRLLPHAARNVGLAAARGDVLVCSDPDVVACRSWLAQLEAAVDGGHQMVGGAMDMQSHPERHRRVAEAIHLTKFWWALPSGIARPAWIVPTANCAFTRILWERIGPFPEVVFCGDAVLSWRASRAGSAPWFLPSATVAHEHLDTAAAMCTQRFRRGKEFARERARWEGWKGGRRFAESVASPLRVAKVMAQARAAATAAGWARAYWRTLDLQTLFHGAWVAGEARGWLSDG
jgi:GT2 family glycosyltransferase